MTIFKTLPSTGRSARLTVNIVGLVTFAQFFLLDAYFDRAKLAAFDFSNVLSDTILLWTVALLLGLWHSSKLNKLFVLFSSLIAANVLARYCIVGIIFALSLSRTEFWFHWSAPEATGPAREEGAAKIVEREDCTRHIREEILAGAHRIRGTRQDGDGGQKSQRNGETVEQATEKPEFSALVGYEGSISSIQKHKAAVVAAKSQPAARPTARRSHPPTTPRRTGKGPPDLRPKSSFIRRPHLTVPLHQPRSIPHTTPPSFPSADDQTAIAVTMPLLRHLPTEATLNRSAHAFTTRLAVALPATPAAIPPTASIAQLATALGLEPPAELADDDDDDDEGPEPEDDTTGAEGSVGGNSSDDDDDDDDNGAAQRLAEQAVRERRSGQQRGEAWRARKERSEVLVREWLGGVEGEAGEESAGLQRLRTEAERRLRVGEAGGVDGWVAVTAEECWACERLRAEVVGRAWDELVAEERSEEERRWVERLLAGEAEWPARWVRCEEHR